MTTVDPGKLWTAHIRSDDVPFIKTSVGGIELRVLHFREESQMMAIQMRAAPFTVSGKHIHLGPVHGFTTAGCWGHDENYEYVKGSYIFEPIGVEHQFFSGPETVNVYFVGYGDSQWIDEETGEIGGSMGMAQQVDRYFQQCEEQGLPRPNILRD